MATEIESAMDRALDVLSILNGEPEAFKKLRQIGLDINQEHENAQRIKILVKKLFDLHFLSVIPLLCQNINDGYEVLCPCCYHREKIKLSNRFDVNSMNHEQNCILLELYNLVKNQHHTVFS